MAAQVIDGRKLAEDIRREISRDVAELSERGIVPGIAVVLVGENPASISYVTAKEKACAEVGIASRDIRLPGSTTQRELLELISRLNADPSIHGILVQLPLPAGIDEQKVLLALDPAKDVDGFHPVSIGNMILGHDTFLPCTPHGVIEVLRRCGIGTDGAHAVIVGRSNIVGRPLANLLSRKGPGGNATVTLCHTGTRDLAGYTRQADILIAAIGRPRFVTADMVKEGAAVIDVGINRVEDPSRARGYRVVGDVDFEAVREKASWITPVPRGIGPMTIAMLLSNTVEAAKKRFASVRGE